MQVNHSSIDDPVQQVFNPADAERALIAAAWGDPYQFARDADRLALHVSDFADRMLGTVAGYIRYAGEVGRPLTLTDAEAVLDSFAVLHSPDELFFLLIDTPESRGDSFADLIMAVQRAADDRRAHECRALARDGWRSMVRGLRCPHCNSRETNPKERRFASPRARKLCGRVIA